MQRGASQMATTDRRLTFSSNGAFHPPHVPPLTKTEPTPKNDVAQFKSAATAESAENKPDSGRHVTESSILAHSLRSAFTPREKTPGQSAVSGGGGPSYTPRLSINKKPPMPPSDVGSLASASATSDLDSLATVHETDENDSYLTKCLAKIPFTVLVALLMMIPVGFLLIYSIISFVEASKTRSFVNNHVDLIRELSECEHSLLLETESTSAMFIANSTEQWEEVLDTRALVDEHCHHLERVVVDDTDAKCRDELLPYIRSKVELIAVGRDRIRSGTIQSIEFRKLYHEIVLMTDKGRSVIANQPILHRYGLEMMSLKFVKLLEIYVLLTDSSGMDVLQNSGPNISIELTSEFAQFTTNYLTFLNQIRAIALHENQQFIAVLENSPHWQAGFALISYMLASAQTGLTFTFNEYEEIFDAIKGMKMPPIADLIIDHIVSDAFSQLIIEACKLTAALIGCIFAASLILRANLQAQRRLDRALQKTRTMNQAVQKFVPRSFLKLCGCTSILHVGCGDQTQVAATLLFSDIRDFTAVSEHMNNEELFTWLQQYFKRMSTVTELNRGFIDKFIGDAIFSVFPSTQDAVECGLDMQMTVGELNLNIVRARGKYLIKIGVGIHHAVVCAGFLGDEHRLTVTMISSEVNMASRLEGLTKRYGAGILLSQKAMDQIPDPEKYEHRRLGEVRVKGSSKPFGITEIYQAELLAMKEYKFETKDQFQEAVSLRAKGDIPKSNGIFEKCRLAASAAGLEDAAVNYKLSHANPVDIFDEK